MLSFDSDWRFGSEHSRFIAEQLRAGGVDALHVEIHSPWGHDSFLLEGQRYHRLIAQALAEPAVQSAAS
jgi:homoserine O-acetyltransferase